MFNIGDEVRITRGVFINYTGLILKTFEYGNTTKYVVSVQKGKSIDGQYIATCDNTEMEKINKQ